MAAAPVDADLRAIEGVAAGPGLLDHAGEVAVDRGDRVAPRSEALQLRVVTVAARLAAQDGPGEQPLAPERDEAAGVEEAGVEGPEAHPERVQLARTSARASGSNGLVRPASE